MPFRAVVTIDNAVLGGKGTNTWHARPGSPDIGRAGFLEDLMGLVETFYTGIGFIFPGGTTLAFDGVFTGVGNDAGTYFETDPWTVAADGTGGSLPPANAICFNWIGSGGDRSKRGRSFIGPIGTQYLQPDGTIATLQLADLRSAAAALVSASEGFANGALGIWSRQEDLFRDMVSSGLRDQFAVLRSRRD